MALIVVLLLSVLLRSAVAVVLGDQVEILPGIFDQLSYHQLAVRVLQGHGFSFEQSWWPLTGAGEPTAHWSYLYTLYLAAVYALFGVHPLAARLIQAILVGLLIPLLAFRLALRVFPDRPVLDLRWLKVDVPLIAMAWTALYGYFIYYSAALMTETFYILAILWSFDSAFRLVEPESKIWGWLELGIALGCAVLLRQVFLLFIPFLFLWLFWRWLHIRKEIGLSTPRTLSQIIWRSCVALAVMAVMITPFTVYNYQRFGRFVLLNTNAGYAFFWANHPVHESNFVAILTPDMPSYQDLIPEKLHGLDEAALESELMQRGLQFVREDPWRYFLLSLSRFKDQFLFWPLSRSPLLSNLVRVGSLGLALPFMIFGAAAWLKSSIGKFRRKVDWIAMPGVILLSFVLIYDAIHLLSWAGIRYRLPTDAVMLVFASYGLLLVARLMGNLTTKFLRVRHASSDV